MPREILHLLSFSLANATLPQLPSHLSDFVQIDQRSKRLHIRGDVSGAPTHQILDALIDLGVHRQSPLWSFSLQGNAERACAFAINLSSSGDRRFVDLLNTKDEWEDSSVAPIGAKLQAGRDANLSKKPQGPFSLVNNNLLASRSALEVLGLTSHGSVYVKKKQVGWYVVRPETHAVLDATLSFSSSDDRPCRSHLANIARQDSDLAFGVATEKEGYSEKLVQNIYLIDIESAAAVFPASRTVLGDVALTPVFPHDSPEGQLMRSITERMNRLPIGPQPH